MNKTVALLSIALFSATAHAASMDTTELWQALDVDINGLISKEEAAKSQVIVDNWDSIEADGDGVISSDEFTRFFTQPPAETK